MKKEYILIACSLLLSLFIYFFYRTGKTVINDLVINFITCDRFLEWQHNVAAAIPLNEFVIYSLPGGLWVFCITLTSNCFFLKIGGYQFDLLFLPVAFAICLEILQLVHLTNGRFDFLDIVVSFLGWSLGYNLNAECSNRKNLIRPFNLQNILCVSSYLIVFLAHVWK